MLCAIVSTGDARARILETPGGASPVQERQGKTGPASVYKRTTKETPKVLLQFQVLADEPPDLLWDFAGHFGRVNVLWYCTRLEVHKHSTVT